MRDSSTNGFDAWDVRSDIGSSMTVEPGLHWGRSGGPRFRRIRCERVFRSWSHWRPRAFRSDAAAQQAIRAGAALVHAEGAVHLNDRALEPNSTPARPAGQGRVAHDPGPRGGRAQAWGLASFSTPAQSVRVLGNGVYRLQSNRGAHGFGHRRVRRQRRRSSNAKTEIRLSDAGTFRLDVQRMDGTGEPHSAGSGSSKAPRPFRS